ncbi:gamma-glutamyl-gamma-aminobutyrate hydrolase family protein [Aidingimonas halophila]|uniref:gamma-glutamyl-gamma-aminobutyrate hydrolase n=1 Tax=Aidingimonas halophila TaxID=574349 RepID=A0A1H2R223_9GAMM|nr:gamma-glutamyl-gamma-aminobutyrate hydrolase family protein [Aidingimonas halophila]GHC19927.1 glutamine amidotransferase [Aidingimonas halophila]SDW13512.1 gamma-glutamyl-gamma-aminobutyrate hydrolase [Aidingimonas halophila]
MQATPVVGVIACRREVEGHPAHVVTDKYLQALREYGMAPVLLPVWNDVHAHASETALLAQLDGLLLTGSYSNVEPSRYEAACAPENTQGDSDRDAAAMAWVPAALDLGLPLFGICRGFQEINVAFGGTLYQAVERVEGLMDHREPVGPKDVRYAPSHDLEILPGGILASLHAQPYSRVNSLHQQGVAELAPGLRAEAVAPDGLVEAVSVEAAEQFALAVQWHPEWQPREHPLYDALFAAYARACIHRKRVRMADTEACVSA